jgi:hypothetical protein
MVGLYIGLEMGISGFETESASPCTLKKVIEVNCYVIIGDEKIFL